MVPLSWLEIFGQMFIQFTPVWIALALIFLLSSILKRRLGLYGRLFDSPIGMLGLFIVLFWVVTALFADMIITHDPLSQVSGMKNKLPGTPVRGEEGAYYLLGGDNLARDIFSRMVMGSRFVLSIAPAATLFAFMVGVTLGLPAGYFGKRLDTILSFLANMVPCLSGYSTFLFAGYTGNSCNRYPHDFGCRSFPVPNSIFNNAISVSLLYRTSEA
jgi:peptide/nickel transport system permease protein